MTVHCREEVDYVVSTDFRKPKVKHQEEVVMKKSPTLQMPFLFSRSFQVEQGQRRLKSYLRQSLAGNLGWETTWEFRVLEAFLPTRRGPLATVIWEPRKIKSVTVSIFSHLFCMN